MREPLSKEETSLRTDFPANWVQNMAVENLSVIGLESPQSLPSPELILVWVLRFQKIHLGQYCSSATKTHVHEYTDMTVFFQFPMDEVIDDLISLESGFNDGGLDCMESNIMQSNVSIHHITHCSNYAIYSRKGLLLISATFLLTTPPLCWVYYIS